MDVVLFFAVARAVLAVIASVAIARGVGHAREATRYRVLYEVEKEYFEKLFHAALRAAVDADTLRAVVNERKGNPC